MVQSLDKKWKELLFACSGFGPNLLMVLMGAYFTDAINPAGLGTGEAAVFQTITGSVCFILPGLFSILYMLARIFDGIIDIPFAHITDSLSTRWGRRRPTIVVSFLPMALSFAMCWLPVGGAEGQLINSIWIPFWAVIFFASYTMCLITFYGSLSTACTSESQRLRVSSYKSVFDTVSYCLVYALVPLVLEKMALHIDRFVFLSLPLMCTMLIPLFLLKEGEKYNYPENANLRGEKLTIRKSLVLTFKNKVFTNWLWVNCCTSFALQLFLAAMNVLIIGGMGFSGTEMAIVNTSAFAPVPLMLYLFNRLKRRRGVRFTYQTCLIAFAVAILSFFFGSRFICGDGNKALQFAIACTGGICGSWAIGSFFMMPYLAAAQISSVEERLTGKNHSAMYFAGNAVIGSVVGALSSLVYENIKMFFFAKGGSVVYAESFDEAAQRLSVAPDEVFNLGILLIPFIVCIICILGAVLAFRMPYDFAGPYVAKALAKNDPSIDLDQATFEEEKEEKQEIVFVQVLLHLLTLFLFGFIWVGSLLGTLERSRGKRVLMWLLCCLVPFAGVIYVARRLRTLDGNAQGTAPVWVFGLLLPLLPVNALCLALVQRRVNRYLALPEGQ